MSCVHMSCVHICCVCMCEYDTNTIPSVDTGKKYDVILQSSIDRLWAQRGEVGVRERHNYFLYILSEWGVGEWLLIITYTFITHTWCKTTNTTDATLILSIHRFLNKRVAIDLF